jgi:hypothetical protein
MTTLTIKINERSKKGKAFLEFAKTFFDNEKDVEIISNNDSLDEVNEEQIFYSTEFVAIMKKAEENIKNGETTILNPDDVWGSLGLK